MVARDAAEVVTSIGGWVFDQAMSGWDAHAFLIELGDARALRILGVRAVHTCIPVATCIAEADETSILAVSRVVYDSDAALRDATRDSRAEVVLWGHGPAERKLDHRRHTVGFSAAAAVFKTHAVAAAGVMGRDAGEGGADECLEVVGAQPSAATRFTAAGGAMWTVVSGSAAVSRPVLRDALADDRSCP